MFRYDETHQGFVNTNTEFTVFKQAWWNNVSIPATVKGSAVVKDSRVFIGAWDGNLYAFDSESGNLLWKNVTSAGSKITGTPAVSESTVYVANEAGTLYAFNAKTGTKEREVSIGATFGSPVVHERRVFIGTGTAGSGGKVLAFEGDSLTKIWEFGASSASGPQGKYFNNTVPDGNVEGSPVVFNGQVLFGATNQWFYSVGEQGTGDGKTTLTWIFKADGAIRSSPAIDRNPSGAKVLFGAQEGKMYAINIAFASGRVFSPAWTFQETGFGLTSQIQSSPAVAYGKAYFGANSGNITALYLNNGTRAWVRPTEGQVISSPAAANNFVIVGSSDRVTRLLHASNGTVAWSHTATSAIESSPAISGTQAFWASTDGSLYSWGGLKPQRADLSIETLTANLIQGQPGTILVVIKNLGQLPAPATLVQVFTGTTLIQAVSVAALGPGNSTEVVATYTPPSAAPLQLRAVVDPTNEIREIDKANNVKTATIPVAPPPPPPTAPTDTDTDAPGFAAAGLLAMVALGIVLARTRRR